MGDTSISQYLTHRYPTQANSRWGLTALLHPRNEVASVGLGLLGWLPKPVPCPSLGHGVEQAETARTVSGSSRAQGK